MAAQREVKCPFCSGNVLVKQAGRPFAAISGFLQRSFKIKLPNMEILTLLSQNMPVSKKSILKKPCAACKGKGSIKDPSDDSSKFEQVKAKAQAAAKEILELENELAPACGNRYTIIQGSDVLEVGLGMNDAPSYRIDKDKSVRAKGLIDPGQIDTKKGGPQIPQGGTCNHVQGITSLASPGGHYTIKCSNKLSTIVGSQGIDINSVGPLNITSGIAKLTAPEISITTQSGRLLLEGQVVNINGKSVEIAPSDGHLFVKGTISNTGNLMVGGHAHLESASVTKMETTGRNEPSKPASPGDLFSGPAFWGGLGFEGLTSSLQDLLGLITSRTANVTEAQQMISLRYYEDLRDKILNLTYNIRPWEMNATGYVLPGTTFIALLYEVLPVTITIVTPVNVNNFPHIHALPNMSHIHETRIPDIECSSDSAEQLRGKQSGVSQSAPLHKTTGSATDMLVGLWSAISTVFVPIWKMIQGSSGPFMK